MPTPTGIGSRKLVGADVPIVATLDAHANVSPQMVAATDALVAYRTNPHLDQHEAGQRAARIMARTLSGEICPTQAAAFPLLAINIQSQNTAIQPLARLMLRAAADELEADVLAQNLLLGFPYADVAEMGTSVVTVTNNAPERAQQLAGALALDIWRMRHDLEPTFTSVDAALDDVARANDRVVLLDMGDNVGGGSPADGTALLRGLHQRAIKPSLVCLHDPMSVQRVAGGGIGWSVELSIGGRGDRHQGRPLQAQVEVLGLYDGKFQETSTRHGGFTEFDQGRSAVVQTSRGVTLLLTSRRVPPFSLAQLTSCGLDPARYRVIVAKGVIAPQAAYREICDRMILVNTPGVTCADMTQLEYAHRRRPMFPFETDTVWP
jgi:microcystin degradation protein MlrC